MDAEKYHPCDRENGFCPPMQKRLTETHRIGLSPLELCHLDTGTFWMAGVVFKSHRGDNGIVLNYCPWCGKDLNWRERPNI